MWFILYLVLSQLIVYLISPAQSITTLCHNNNLLYTREQVVKLHLRQSVLLSGKYGFTPSAEYQGSEKWTDAKL